MLLVVIRKSLRMEFSVYVLLIVISGFLVHNVNSYLLTEPIDLTWHFENSTIYWPGQRPFEFTKMEAGYMVEKGVKFWAAMNEFCAGEHGGTHIDAPYHFNKNGAKLGYIPLKNLIVPGVVIDMSDEVEQNGPNTTLEPHHITSWEAENGPIPPKSLVLVKFGWSQYYPNKEAYLGPEHANGNLSFPGISGEAAQILASRYVVGVGVDTASTDPGYSTIFPAHQILQAQEIYLLENVKLIEHLPPRGFTLLALPMNIAEGTAGPLRLVAVPSGYI